MPSIAPQYPRANDKAVDKAVRIAESIVRANQFALLSNFGADELPHSIIKGGDQIKKANAKKVVQSRVVQPQSPPPGIKHINILTTKFSRKYKQLRQDPGATLTYTDFDGLGYVTLVGAVRFLDEAEAMALFLPEYNMFFPKGTKHGGYVMMRFVPDVMEVSSQRFRLCGTRDDWLPHRFTLSRDGDWTLADLSCDL